jgi:hypothetical protein
VLWNESNALAAEGRDSEAAVAWELAKREFWNVPPLAGAMVAMHDEFRGTGPTILDPSWYRKTVEDKVVSDFSAPGPDGSPSYAQTVLAHAGALKALANYTEIEGFAQAFNYTVNSGIRVMKFAVVSHLENGALPASPRVDFYQDDNDNYVLNNEVDRLATIHLKLPNKRPVTATYYLHDEFTETLSPENITYHTPFIELDLSGSDPGSTSYVLSDNAHTIVREGEGSYYVMLSKALQPVANADRSAPIAGFIQGGAGFSEVDFTRAQSAQIIHAGTGYSGFSSYNNVDEIVGTKYGDLITVYGGVAHVPREPSVLAGGGGSDTFDLRSGSNDVYLTSGTVYMNRDGSASAESLGQSFDPTISLASLRAEGPYASSGYEDLYANNFTTDNTNRVYLVRSLGADAASFAIYGNDQSKDTVSGQFWANGMSFHTDASGGTELADYRNGEIGTALGFADRNVNSLIGTRYADNFVITSDSTLDGVAGFDGADTFDIGKAGISVLADSEGNLVLLRASASGAAVEIGAGGEIQDAVGAAANGTDQVTVRVEALGGEAHVDATTTGQGLKVGLASGSVTIDLGTVQTNVEVGQLSSALHLAGSAAGTPSVLITFDDPSLDLKTTVHFMKDGAGTNFVADWTDSSGIAKHVDYTGNPENVLLKAGSVQWHLSDLVAAG